MTPILAYLARARQTLQQLAGAETDPTTLIQMAEAHAALNRAAELWHAGAVDADRISGTVHVHDGYLTYVVGLADPTTPTGLACDCDQAHRSYRGVCAHIAAARLAEVHTAYQCELAQRRERRRQLGEAQIVYFAAVAEREAIHAAYRDAEEREAQAFARSCELLTQVRMDEQNAAQEQAAARATSSIEVAA